MMVARAILRVGLFGFLALPACAARSMALIHPESGATVLCSEEGGGLAAVNVGILLDRCVGEQKARGYIPVDKLAPQQRADLERRGLLGAPARPGGY